MSRVSKPKVRSVGFESLGVMAAEAPYRVPAKLDLSRVESLLTARASAAEDHLWALREDPEYFSRVILEAKDHRQEMLKDTAGGSHPVFRHGQQDIIWSRIICRVVSKAYLEVEMFSELSIQARNLVLLEKKYAGQITPSEDLPEEYQSALIRFRYYVNQFVKEPLETLKHTAVASPPLRKLFSREPATGPVLFDNSNYLKTRNQKGQDRNSSIMAASNPMGGRQRPFSREYERRC